MSINVIYKKLSIAIKKLLLEKVWKTTLIDLALRPKKPCGVRNYERKNHRAKARKKSKR